MSKQDTNQASEDRLTQAIYEAMQIPYLSERHDAIKDLIRTEKLKLLVEVREEAFSGGLSFELDDGQIVIEVETDLKSITTKLEAEL